MSILQTTMFRDCSEEVLEELMYRPGEENSLTSQT